MKVTAKALEKGPGGWVGTTEDGERKVLGAGSWLRAGGEGIVVSRSPKVSVRCIGLVFTEDKRGARGSPSGGLSLVGKGSEVGRGRQGRWGGEEGRDSVCLYIYIEI